MILVKVDADTDASKEQINELMLHVKRTSPELDILTNSVPVNIEII